MKTYKVSIWYWLYASATAAAIFLLFTGCMSTSYTHTEPNGEKIAFSSKSLWTKKQIDSAEGQRGDVKFKLKGYSNNQTEIAMQALLSALQAYTRQQPPATTNQP